MGHTPDKARGPEDFSTYILRENSVFYLFVHNRSMHQVPTAALCQLRLTHRRRENPKAYAGYSLPSMHSLRYAAYLHHIPISFIFVSLARRSC